ncbi:hypothetical protein FDP41_010718 [Naegleria fowleri]|uniref:Uncharacterized protein n=1 Tax=Naegleria fowleri TaxID=5763 RepID=A0A6A5CBU6_NAEFO|nr:uncharacterized protein FDP41_010718 [Naegleria fowleri]KAF0982739.1 hypothetical protein FDP41_010718 [Naegleria fowleri]
MLDNNETTSNSSGVLTLSNPSTTSSYIHGVNNDYYLPPSGEREDMNNSNMSSSEDAEPMSTADQMDFSESGLDVHEYGSFASRMHDFSSPITTKAPPFPEKNLQQVGSAKKGVVQAPPRPPNPFTSIPPALNHHSTPISNNVINSITTTTTIPTTNMQPEPSSPSNTFREFLEGEVYKRPARLSPLSVDNIVEEQQTINKTKQSSTKVSSSSATTTGPKQPTNPSVNINSSKQSVTSSSTTTATNGNTVTEQKVEPPQRPTISNKTLLLANRLTAQPSKPQQQEEESNNESSDHEMSTKKTLASKKESKKRSSHESDSENNMEDISYESSEESDKKSKKKKSTTQPEQKKKAEKETKIKGVKSRKTKSEGGESSQSKKSSSDSKKTTSPKRPLEDVVESKVSVNEEPKTKRNKQPTPVESKNVSIKTENSNASSSTSTHTNTTSTKSSSANKDVKTLQQKLDSKRQIATTLKHKADDLKKDHQISEAISTYLASGMKYSEAAMYSKQIFENTPKEKNPSTSGTAILLKQNIDFLKYVSSLALKYAYYDKAVLANILIFTNTKALFNFKTQSIQRYRRYLLGKFGETNSTSVGSSSITSPAAVASPSSQSISTPSPVHNGGAMISSVGSAELTNTIMRLCEELEIVSMVVENEVTLYHQLKQHETYRENYELMHEAQRGNIDFVVKFLDDELARLDSSE